MKINDSFDMIGLIVSLILSEDFDATVESLSSACGVSESKMQKYLDVIFDNKILEPYGLADPKDINNGLSASEAAREDINEFLEYCYLLPITPVEAGAVNGVYPDLIKNQRKRLFEIKDTIDSIPESILKKQEVVQNAILSKSKIHFSYISSHSGLKNVVCSPVSVVDNLTTHILYIKDSDNKYYHMDRITSKIVSKGCSDIDKYTPSPYQKYFWGTEHLEHGEPVHVKIRISPNTSNIIEKIKSDTALRHETCKWYQDGDYYYYEDDILGMSEFRRWLRSYGSSITVIEPQSLIDEITDGVKKALAYYKKLV
jgi:hypothetical protein